MRLAIKLARDSLRTHRFRTFLATIGTIISVCLISSILIISDSLKVGIKNQASQLNSNTIIINGAEPSDNILNISTTAPSNSLTDLDYQNIRRYVRGQNGDAQANTIVKGTVGFGDNSLDNTTTIATSITNPDNLHVKMVSGEWFGNDDSNKNWVILGNDLANRLIGSTTAQNQIVTIKGRRFTVVGVIDKVNQPLSIFGYNIDQAAFISLAQGQKITNSSTVGQIIVNGGNASSESLRRDIAKILSREHPDGSDYSISTGDKLASQLSQLINYIAIISFVFAGVTLLISGISIMNIMLVSVIERQREIGIRKAVGATTRNIMGQFIAESFIMSVRGGLIGLALAYIISAIILIFCSVSVTFSWSAVIIGFLIPVAIGIFFGVYPAYRASRQDIIEALNQLT